MGQRPLRAGFGVYVWKRGCANRFGLVTYIELILVGLSDDEGRFDPMEAVKEQFVAVRIDLFVG
jgi:hypothetical protein